MVARNIFVDGYQPIRVGNGSFALQIDGPRKKGVVRYDTYDFDPGEIVVIPFQKGGSLRMVFPIFHDGSRAIRITHIAQGPEPSRFVTILDPAGIETGPQTTVSPTAAWSTHPFRPFVLRPDDNPVIGLRYDFVCQRPGDAMEIRDTFDLRFELWGSSRWVRLPLPWRLVLQSATKVDCPPGSAVYR
jgi:hypothetical protein